MLFGRFALYLVPFKRRSVTHHPYFSARVPKQLAIEPRPLAMTMALARRFLSRNKHQLMCGKRSVLEEKEIKFYYLFFKKAEARRGLC
jgi:hypothetical protein